MVNFPLCCPKCKKETLVTIAQLKMMPTEEMAP
ncbi:cysteine-rich KTR domain-containing protein [Ruthenibacterium lactatiformans]